MSRPLREITEYLAGSRPSGLAAPATPDDLRGRGFSGLVCWACSAPDCLALHLAAVATFECRACGVEFTTAAVRDHLDRWGAVLAWLALCPKRPE